MNTTARTKTKPKTKAPVRKNTAKEPATKKAARKVRSAERGPDKKPRSRRPKTAVGSEAISVGDQLASLTYQQARAERERQEARLKKSKADMAEIELRRVRGELIELAEVEREAVNKVMVLKHRLLALPHQLPPQFEGLEPRQMAAIMKAQIEDMIREFAGQR